MDLSRTERIILANQARILQALDPDEAEHWQQVRTVLEHGYALHYSWVFEDVYLDEHAMTAAECSEVLEILDMHRALKWAYTAFPDTSGIEEHWVRFSGFCGNEESKQLAYARFYCNLDGGRYADMDRGDDLNSHMPVLDKYRRMLTEWRTSDDKFNLTKEEVVRITSA